jgi:hypothetical protein
VDNCRLALQVDSLSDLSSKLHDIEAENTPEVPGLDIEQRNITF